MRIAEHRLHAETWVRRPLDDVFPFFAAAENLERITPPSLRFHILTPLPIAMTVGTLIEYRLRLFGVPFCWTSRITQWRPPNGFVDEQIRGPYAMWIHTHAFRAEQLGTTVIDDVRFRLPFFPLGELAYPVVRLNLRWIFAYRRRRMYELLELPHDSLRGGGP